ncbi:MAG TPA: YfcE family phosphodiesterase [bacterium]|nr:YfcE family phosphodiesterase [bacterium]
MVFGVLADTQAPLTPAQLAALRRAFRGVDALLHAGPVGDLRVLEQLKALAPVRAVSGNAESPQVRSELYIRQAWRQGALTLGLMHGYGKPHGLRAWLLSQFEEGAPQVLVYGRDFEPFARQVGGTYFFNPGSFSGRGPEGSRGPGAPKVGLLFLQGKKVDGQPGIPC